MINVLDHGYVNFVESWGSDERVIESARMSTDGAFRGWGPTACPNGECVDGREPRGGAIQDCLRCGGTGSVSGDEKLLRYLWEHKHTTPFEMAGMTIEVQAPIFVFRQWHRHRTMSYNELSGRYTSMPELYYHPSIDRLRDSTAKSKNKQAGGDGRSIADSTLGLMQSHIEFAYMESRKVYNNLRAQGISDEVARIVLPLAQYSRMRATANLWNWFRFLTQRCDEHAQYEIREYANAVAMIIAERFPRCYQLWREGFEVTQSFKSLEQK